MPVEATRCDLRSLALERARDVVGNDAPIGDLLAAAEAIETFLNASEAPVLLKTQALHTAFMRAHFGKAESPALPQMLEDASTLLAWLVSAFAQPQRAGSQLPAAGL